MRVKVQLVAVRDRTAEPHVIHVEFHTPDWLVARRRCPTLDQSPTTEQRGYCRRHVLGCSNIFMQLLYRKTIILLVFFA